MNTQIERIKHKLSIVADCDKDLIVFGADAHQYKIGDVVSEKVISDFEQKYTIKLPEAYVAFLTQIGNGNVVEDAYMGSAAGPYYGIYPLGECLDDVNVEDIECAISKPSILYPGMKEEEWDEYSKSLCVEDISDEDYYAVLEKLYSGLLAIGTQGCAITTCLVLNGEYKGRIVYLNEDYQPVFAHEEHFLDWYERWLDEVISGDLVSEGAGWFGYSIGGNSAFLWDSYKSTHDETQQLTLLDGLLKKSTIEAYIIQEIIDAIPNTPELIALSLTTILSKENFTKAIPFLEQQVSNNLLHVLQRIHWYGKDKSYWLPMLKANSASIEDEETYRFYTYVLTGATPDYGELVLAGLQSPNKEIRGQAIYTLGQLKNKQAYLDYFIQCLHDQDERVILYTIQGLAGVHDDRLVDSYKEVYKKYKESEEENYILINLQHRLTELGMIFKDLEE